MVYTTELKLRTSAVPAQEITGAVAEAIAASGVKQGIVLVETGNAASGVLRAPAGNEKAMQDVMKELRHLVPARINFANEESPENAAGCVKCALFGASVACAVVEGALSGVENGIYFMDYDGPRTCTCTVCVLGQ